MAKKSNKELFAILGLILNILVIPGLGSLVSGRKKEGIWQLIFYAIGFGLLILGALGFESNLLFVLPMLFGFLLLFLAWIWAIITSVSVLRKYF
jgi:hypothetical protein